MPITQITTNNSTPNFCGGRPKIRNKTVRALYHRNYGEYTPTSINVNASDSKLIKGLKNFANIFKYLFL